MGGGASKRRDHGANSSPGRGRGDLANVAASNRNETSTSMSSSPSDNDGSPDVYNETMRIKQAFKNRSELTGNPADASYSSDGRRSGSHSAGISGSSQFRDGSHMRLRQRVEALEKRELMNEAHFNRARRGSLDVVGMKESLARQAEASGAPALRRANSTQASPLKRTSSLSSRIHGPLERQRSAAERSTGFGFASPNSGGGSRTNSSKSPFLDRASNKSGSAKSVRTPPPAKPDDTQQTYLKNRVAQLDEQIGKIKVEQKELLQSIQSAVAGSSEGSNTAFIQVLQQQMQQHNQILDALVKQRAQVEQTLLFMMRSAVQQQPSKPTSLFDANNATLASSDMKHAEPAFASAGQLGNELSDPPGDASSLLFF